MIIPRLVVAAIAILVACSCAAFAEDADDGVLQTETVAKSEKLVSISANDESIVDVVKSLAEQSGEKILVESAVKTNVKVSIKDVSFEKALEILCKSAKLDWRKIYMDPESELLKQPDRLAATVRLMTGLSFPDLVLADASNKKILAHLQTKKAVESAVETAREDSVMIGIYLITNDTAVAAKASDDEKTEKHTAVEKYIESTKKLLDDFMAMTPEERERTILASINLMNQVDASYMGAAMEALANTDQTMLHHAMSRQTEMFMSMSPETRRAVLKMNINMQSMMPPELRMMMEDDLKIIMEEMKAEQDGLQN